MRRAERRPAAQKHPGQIGRQRFFPRLHGGFLERDLRQHRCRADQRRRATTLVGEGENPVDVSGSAHIARRRRGAAAGRLNRLGELSQRRRAAGCENDMRPRPRHRLSGRAPDPTTGSRHHGNPPVQPGPPVRHLVLAPAGARAHRDGHGRRDCARDSDAIRHAVDRPAAGLIRYASEPGPRH